MIQMDVHAFASKYNSTEWVPYFESNHDFYIQVHEYCHGQYFYAETNTHIIKKLTWLYLITENYLNTETMPIK